MRNRVVVVVVCCATLSVVPFDSLLSRFNKLFLLFLPLPCGETQLPSPLIPVVLVRDERRLRPILSLVMLEARRFMASREVCPYHESNAVSKKNTREKNNVKNI